MINRAFLRKFSIVQRRTYIPIYEGQYLFRHIDKVSVADAANQFAYTVLMYCESKALLPAQELRSPQPEGYLCRCLCSVCQQLLSSESSLTMDRVMVALPYATVLLYASIVVTVKLDGRACIGQRYVECVRKPCSSPITVTNRCFPRCHILVS